MSHRATAGNSRHSGYARAANDWYIEPPDAVCALFERETFAGSIHDPACGSGTIPFAWFVFGSEQKTAELGWIDRMPDASDKLLTYTLNG